MLRDTNYEDYYMKEEQFYKCNNCPDCYTELEEVQQHVLITHRIDVLSEEGRKRTFDYYTALWRETAIPAKIVISEASQLTI